jgi:Cytidylyltransferase-like
VEDILQEDTVGEQTRRAAVTVGRFNPPTIGHYKVIDAMKAFIRKRKDLRLEAMPVVVIIEGGKTSKDKDKNPLSAGERERFMKASGKANGVHFLSAPSAFAAFEEVRKAGLEPVAIAAGSDRAPRYMEMLDKYFTSKAGETIERHLVPGLERDADNNYEDGDEAFQRVLDVISAGEDVPLSMISGSLARYAARTGQAGPFAYITGLTEKPALAKKLLTKVKGSSDGIL